MTTIAFIGLGAMGSRMVANLLAAGFKLRVYNRDRAKAEPLAAKGAEVCASAAAACLSNREIRSPTSRVSAFLVSASANFF